MFVTRLATSRSEDICGGIQEVLATPSTTLSTSIFYDDITSPVSSMPASAASAMHPMHQSLVTPLFVGLALLLSSELLYAQDASQEQLPPTDVTSKKRISEKRNGTDKPQRSLTSGHPDLESRLSHIEARLDTLVDAIKDEISEAKSFRDKIDERVDGFEITLAQHRTIGILFSLSATLIGILAAFGIWKRLGKLISDRTDAMLEKKVDAAEEKWKKGLDIRIDTFEKQVNQKLFDITDMAELSSQVQALRHARQYTDALKLSSWDGTPESLDRYPKLLRMTIIECAGRQRRERNDAGSRYDRKEIWNAAQSVADISSASDVAFLLREAILHYEYQDGLDIYEKSCGDEVDLDDECHRLACVLLRGLGQSQRALSLALQYSKGADIRHRNTLASLLVDDGQTDKAATILRDDIARFEKIPQPRRPKGWHLATTSFLNICIELSQPSQGVAAAKMLLQESPDNVSLYVCGLLAKLLSDEAEEKSYIFTKIKENLLTHQKVQGDLARALLIEHTDGPDESIQFLKTRIHELRTKLEGNSVAGSRKTAIQSDLSRLVVHKCRALMDVGELSECRRCLLEVSSFDKYGDASYMLARCSVMQGNTKDATSFLEIAFDRRRKWESLAQKEPVFQKAEEVNRWLKRRITEHTGA